MKKSRYNTARKWLIFWTLFIGIGAVAGATGMFADTTGKAMGMDKMLPYFKVLPFSDILFKDYLFSGFALLIVNGLTNLTASVLLFMKKKIGIILGGVFGITLMLWICIQFYMFPLNFMSTIYFVFGLCQAITGFASWVFFTQETYAVSENDYKNIGTDSSKLVVYFSRMGYTKKLALEQADRTGADILELKAREKTSGTLGFWWCGRFGMHRWRMSLEELNVDLTKYNHITICSPIWVFAIASPIRDFCVNSKGKIKNADLFVIHFSKGKYINAKDEVEKLLGIKLNQFKSICCRFGKLK